MKNMDFDFFLVSFDAAIRLCLPLPFHFVAVVLCCHGSFRFILTETMHTFNFTLEEFRVLCVIAYCLCIYRKHSAHSHKITTREERAAAVAVAASVPIHVHNVCCV